MQHSPQSTNLTNLSPASHWRRRLAATRVLVIGDVMLDRYWLGDVCRISPEAPVPVVQVAQSDERLGGAANVARNIVALGAQASLLGVVGDDEAGERILQLLTQADIRDCVVMRPEARTIVKLRVLGQRQQLLRIDFDGERERSALDINAALLSALMSEHHVVVLSDYAKGCLADPQTVIAIARSLQCPVMIDPKGEDFSRYANATMLTPNIAELRLIVGHWQDEDDLAQRAQALRDALSLQSLLLTRSAQGISIYDAAGSRHFRSEAKEVFDVSGAGDTVIAALAALTGAGLDQDSAIALANRAAGLVVGKLGTATADFAEVFADRFSGVRADTSRTAR